MTKAICERRGDYDNSRLQEALIYRVNNERLAVFANEHGTIGIAVDMPGGSALCYSIDPAEFLEMFRDRSRFSASPTPKEGAEPAGPDALRLAREAVAEVTRLRIVLDAISSAAMDIQVERSTIAKSAKSELMASRARSLAASPAPQESEPDKISTPT